MPLRTASLLALAAQAVGYDPIPSFEINLDAPPRTRWQGVAKYYRHWFMKHYDLTSVDIPNDPWSKQQYSEFMKTVKFPSEIAEEIEGFVEALNHPNASVEVFTKRQVLYEMGLTQGFACSGIIASKANGRVVHGRNLDLGVQYKFAERVTFEAVFMRGGKQIARGPTFLGNVGMHTGLHVPSGWSIEQNTRVENFTNWTKEVAASNWVAKTIQAAKAGGKMTLLETRRLLTTHDNFVDALDAFTNTKWLAPQYFILAGGGEYQGAVVSVGRAMPDGSHFYDLNLMSKATGRWLIVQTNDDHWLKPLDGRRVHARKVMAIQRKNAGGINADNIFFTLRSIPLCNAGTLFTWVCDLETNEEQFDMGKC